MLKEIWYRLRVWLWRLRSPTVRHLEAGAPGGRWCGSGSLQAWKPGPDALSPELRKRGAGGSSCCAKCVWPLVTPRTAAVAPLSRELSRLECWGGLPSPPLEDLPDPGMDPSLLHLLQVGGFFTTEPPRKLGEVLVQVQKPEKQERPYPRAGENGRPSSSEKGKSRLLHHCFLFRPQIDGTVPTCLGEGGLYSGYRFDADLFQRHPDRHTQKQCPRLSGRLLRRQADSNYVSCFPKSPLPSACASRAPGTTRHSVSPEFPLFPECHIVGLIQ